MNRIALSVVVLMGCGADQYIALGLLQKEPVPDCVSSCGVKLFGSTNCQAFQRVEDLTLGAFEANVTHPSSVRPFKVTEMCSSLKGWRVSVVPVVATGIAGRFNPEAGAMSVMTDQWAGNAYSHEMAHLAQWMYGRRTEENPEHPSFWSEGYYPAIISVLEILIAEEK